MSSISCQTLVRTQEIFNLVLLHHTLDGIQDTIFSILWSSYDKLMARYFPKKVTENRPNSCPKETYPYVVIELRYNFYFMMRLLQFYSMKLGQKTVG